MTILVLGPNGSGKSAYAEKLSAGLSASALYYIATMVPYGEAGQARVKKHRKQRAALGFITIEQPFDLFKLPIPPGATVLLEDVSNLLANALFGGKGSGREDNILADITAMCGKCCNAVLVSIDGLTALPAYDAQTRGYIDALNQLNGKLCHFVDMVIYMRDGIPVLGKGEGLCTG